MARKPMSVAFAGTGETTEANVKALLDDWMPEKDQDGDDLPYNPPVVPDPVRRAHKGLSLCLDWVTDAFGKDVERQPLSNVVPALKSARDDEDDPADAYLVYIPGGDDDPHLEIVKEAIAAGIPVKDITAGLDDYQLSEPPAAEPEKPRTRGRSRTVDTGEISGQASMDDVLNDTPPWDTGGPESDSKASESGGTPSPTENTDSPAASSSAPAPATVPQVPRGTPSQELLVALHNFVAEMLEGFIQVYGLKPAAGPKTYPFFVDDDGNYRPVKGRGRPRAGEKHVELTEQEILAAKAAGADIDIP